MSCSLFNSRKRHNAACMDPQVREMLQALQSDWKDLDAFERGEILINLVSSGCSARGLANVLPCAASTILRYMDLADLEVYLSEEQRSALSFGFSAARFLCKWDPKDRRECHKERQPGYIEQVSEIQPEEEEGEALSSQASGILQRESYAKAAPRRSC
jgi:hypothetical protein